MNECCICLCNHWKPKGVGMACDATCAVRVHVCLCVVCVFASVTGRDMLCNCLHTTTTRQIHIVSSKLNWCKLDIYCTKLWLLTIRLCVYGKAPDVRSGTFCVRRWFMNMILCRWEWVNYILDVWWRTMRRWAVSMCSCIQLTQELSRLLV